MRENHDNGARLWLVLSVLAMLVLATLQVSRAQAPERAATPQPGPAAAFDWPPGLDRVQARREGRLVVLEGTVAREADRELAEKIARADPATAEVLNRIEVDASVPTRLRSALDAGARRLVRLAAQLPLLLLGLLIVGLAWRAGRWVSRRAWLGRATRNPFAADVLRQTVRWLVLLGGVLLALQLLDATSIAAAVLGSAGVAGIALGFAFRDLLENYLAGVLLSLRQPFSPDDAVKVDAHEGVVVGMNSRATLLMTYDGNHLTLPNAMVFKAVVMNYSRNPRRRFGFLVPIDPAAPAAGALDAARAALRATGGVLADPAPTAHLEAVSRDEVSLQCYGWLDQHRCSYANVRSEALRQVRHALRQAGVAVQPPALRLLPNEPAPPVAPAVPREPQSEPAEAGASEGAAVQDAVQRTREEMGERNLMQGGARE